MLSKFFRKKQPELTVVPMFKDIYLKYLNFSPSSSEEGLGELIEMAENDPQLKSIAQSSSQRVVYSIGHWQNFNIDRHGKFEIFTFEDLVGQVGVENSSRDFTFLNRYPGVIDKMKRGIADYIREAPYQVN